MRRKTLMVNLDAQKCVQEGQLRGLMDVAHLCQSVRVSLFLRMTTVIDQRR